MKKFVNVYTLSLVISFLVISISVAYAAFGKNINVTGTIANVRKEADMRVTGLSVSSSENGGLSTYEDYNISSLSMGVNLPNSNSTVTYKVSITNLGEPVMGIKSISGIPSGLTYTLTDYTLKNKICDSNDVCNLGITKDFYITIKYTSSGYDSTNTTRDITLNFTFAKFYNITYGFGVDPNSSAPTTVMEGENAVINYSTKHSTYNIKMNGENLQRVSVAPTAGYYATPMDGITILPPATGDVEINRVCNPAKPSQMATLTDGNLVGKISSSSYSMGDEYICNVDGVNEYRFYILSMDDTYVNLILDRNIHSSGALTANSYVSNVAWLASSDGSSISDGPITAFNMLHPAVSNWINIPSQSINHMYTDATSTGFSTSGTTVSLKNAGTVTATYDNLKARMPYTNEITTTGCTSATGNCPAWMVNHLMKSTYTVSGLTNNSGIIGYWGLPDVSTTVPLVNNDGAMKTHTFYGGITHSVLIGIRPVITLKKTDLNVKTLFGDLSQEGLISATDTNLLSRYLLGQVTFNEQQMLNADIYYDGVIDDNDLNLLEEVAAGIGIPEPVWPTE